MNYVFHEGTFKDASKGVIKADNRAFHYADGFYETIRVINGQIFKLENHYSRIEDAIAVYQMTASDFSMEKLKSEIEALLQKNEITQGAKVRVTFYRMSDGNYLSQTNQIEYLIETFPLEDNYFKLNEEGKTIDLYPDMRKEINPLSMFKTINCSLYILSGLYAKSKDLDIALIQNYKNTIVESHNANIFIVSNRVLYTPPLTEGCTAGTMRMNIINLALENGLKTYETELNPQYLLTADEVFLTNSVSGIQWVSSYRSKRYFNNLSKELIVLLNQYVSEHL